MHAPSSTPAPSTPAVPHNSILLAPAASHDGSSLMAPTKMALGSSQAPAMIETGDYDIVLDPVQIPYAFASIDKIVQQIERMNIICSLLAAASLFLSAHAQSKCQCGTGYDYGCDQRNCGPGATCLQGHCNQDGLDSPTCDGGDCSQINATNASCEPGNCCPPLEDGTCLKSVGSADCIGEDMRVFSCSMDTYMPVRELSVGDSIRALSSDTGKSVCSEVYYLFKHKAKGTAYVIQVAGQDEDIVLSPNHLLYVGNSFEHRHAVLAKNVRINDVLVSSHHIGDGDVENQTPKVVLSIQMKDSYLVNVLAFDPAIEIEGGVVISAYSFNEKMYSYIFWPFALSYKYFGPTHARLKAILADTTLEKIDERAYGIVGMLTASFLPLTLI